MQECVQQNAIAKPPEGAGIVVERFQLLPPGNAADRSRKTRNGQHLLEIDADGDLQDKDDCGGLKFFVKTSKIYLKATPLNISENKVKADIDLNFQVSWKSRACCHLKRYQRVTCDTTPPRSGSIRLWQERCKGKSEVNPSVKKGLQYSEVRRKLQKLRTYALLSISTVTAFKSSSQCIRINAPARTEETKCYVR
jgi:hypothetical protein